MSVGVRRTGPGLVAYGAVAGILCLGFATGGLMIALMSSAGLGEPRYPVSTARLKQDRAPVVAMTAPEAVPMDALARPASVDPTPAEAPVAGAEPVRIAAEAPPVR